MWGVRTLVPANAETRCDLEGQIARRGESQPLDGAFLSAVAQQAQKVTDKDMALILLYIMTGWMTGILL